MDDARMILYVVSLARWMKKHTKQANQNMTKWLKSAWFGWAPRISAQGIGTPCWEGKTGWNIRVLGIVYGVSTCSPP